MSRGLQRRLAVALTSVGIFFLSLPQAWGQGNQYNFKHYQSRDGLARNFVSCIMQDSHGFIWIGTEGSGVNKYNGQTFTRYSRRLGDSTSLSANRVRCVEEGPDGDIWVGTHYGLNRFDVHSEKFEQYYDEDTVKGALTSNTITGLYLDKNNALWIAAWGGLFVYNQATNDFTTIRNNLTDSIFVPIRAISPMGSDQLLVGSDDYLAIVDINTKQTLKLFDQVAFGNNKRANQIADILYDRDGNIWYGTKGNGLFKITDFDKGEAYAFSKGDGTGIRSNTVDALAQDSEGVIWVGTSRGLLSLTPEEQRSPSPVFEVILHNSDDELSLSDDHIIDIMLDRDQNLWVGTTDGGLNFLHHGRRKFNHYRVIENKKHTITDNFIHGFAELGENVLVATDHGGLNVFNYEKGVIKTYSTETHGSKGLLHNSIRAVCPDGDGDFWLAIPYGIQYFDSKAGTFTEKFKGSVKSNLVRSIMKGNGDDLWITTPGGLIRGNTRTGKSRTYLGSLDDPTALASSPTYQTLLDKKGNLWVGTFKGLSRYDPVNDSFINFYHDENDLKSISSEYVITLAEDDWGNLWVGTVDGLNKLNNDGKTFTIYDERHGLPDNSIDNIKKDDQGALWITTRKGISKIELMRESDSITVRSYGPSDGLQGNEFINNSALKDSKGRIYFGGKNGFNVFSPSSMHDNEKPPNVLISGLKLFNKPVEIGTEDSPLTRSILKTDSITLNHNQSVITFEFIALNYTSPEKNQYAYMMEGFDEDWTYSGSQRQAHYTNLPAGEYIFRVKASNNDRVWNEEGATLYIEILPAWYSSWWFRVLMGILVLAAILYYSKWRTEKFQRDKQQLNDKVDEATAQVTKQNAELESQKDSLLMAIAEINHVVAEAVESGNYQARINLQDKSGQWKDLANSINEMFESVLRPFQEINGIVDGMASGDLTRRFSAHAKGDVAELGQNFNMALSQLSALLLTITGQIESIGESSEEMLSGTEEMNVSTSEMATSISQMSEGAQQQVAKVDESTLIIQNTLKFSESMRDQANLINASTRSGVEKSETGMKQIEMLDEKMKRILEFSARTNDSIHTLAERSQDINSVLRIIKDIASQTNLLALNAAIEAAQAGDSGRGFAVVAEEIRRLAEDSKRSAGEIEMLISGVQDDTKSTANLIKEMSTSITEGEKATQLSRSAFEEITNGYQDTLKQSQQIVQATKEQTDVLGNVVKMMNDIVVIAEETASGTEQTASSAAELATGMNGYMVKSKQVSNITQQLRDRVSRFKLE